jgi:hypothetical protein
MGISVVENKAGWGIYVWMLDNGKPFSDGNGNIMNIPGKPFDIDKLSKITQAAKYYGAGKGEAKFLPGVQRSSEMRHSEEVGRMKAGLLPSETDIGAWADAQRGLEEARRRGYDYDAE